MSRKTRAFALAAATASLVGLSAPVAGAAALQGGPSGFNNDSILNLSGNQIPIAACNLGIRHIVVHRGRHHSVSVTSINTPADNGPSGFNGDSVLNVSNNQIPATICNAAVPITATGLQVPITFIGGVLGSGALNSTTQNPSLTQGCTPSATQNNSSTFNTNSNNG